MADLGEENKVQGVFGGVEFGNSNGFNTENVMENAGMWNVNWKMIQKM